jgi:hypothetical protein
MLRRSLLALALLAVLPALSFAGPFTAYGPQFGFTSSPDQFFIGGHLKWGGVAQQLDFVPGIDLGFGDNSTIVSLNGDFHYRLATKTTWRPYLGAGVGIHFVSEDNSGPTTDNSNTVTGGQFIAGADVLAKGGSRFFTELKLGFNNSPDMKVVAGFNFSAH